MTKKVRVLSLSGGGYRGLFTIRFLKQLERATGKSISEHFDLITGSSIGGIIALAIASGKSMEDIEKVFVDKGASIFSTPIKNARDYYGTKTLLKWYRNIRACFLSIHSPKQLEEVLTELFGKDTTMAELNQAWVMVTATNLTTGEPKMFKTSHASDLTFDADKRVIDVALATSAAPVFFPMHKIDSMSATFADGGLMGNAPAFYGWLEAKTRLQAAEEDISVLSIAPLGTNLSISSSHKLSKGALFWLSPGKLRLMTFLMNLQEKQTNNILSIIYRGKTDNYHHIDERVNDESASDIDIDKTDTSARNTLISYADKAFTYFQNSNFYHANIKNHKDEA